MQLSGFANVRVALTLLLGLGIVLIDSASRVMSMLADFGLVVLLLVVVIPQLCQRKSEEKR